MKRTKSEAEETRRRLLEAGLNVFLERGFERASLEEIAQRVNMTRGAVYWHFNDKQALLDELISEGLEPRLKQLENVLLDQEFTPLQRITSFMKMLLHLLAEDREFRETQQLLRRCWASVPAYSSQYSLWQDNYLKALEDLYWQAQADRAVLGYANPKQLATYTLAVISGLSQHLLDLKDEDTEAERKRLADQMVFLFMRSLQ